MTMHRIGLHVADTNERNKPACADELRLRRVSGAFSAAVISRRIG
jgi:hypothetical protein